jgi:hypothetical protein
VRNRIDLVFNTDENKTNEKVRPHAVSPVVKETSLTIKRYHAREKSNVSDLRSVQLRVCEASRGETENKHRVP